MSDLASELKAMVNLSIGVSSPSVVSYWAAMWRACREGEKLLGAGATRRMLIRGLSLGSLTPAETDLGYRIRPKKRLKLLWAQNTYTAITVKNIAGRKT